MTIKRKNIKKYLFPIVIAVFNLLSFLIIIFLGNEIIKIQIKINNRTRFLYSIGEKDFIFPANIRLNYYFEPRPNHTQKFNTEWLDYEIKYTFNSDGLNERFDYSKDKEKNVYRIIAIGDSFTFGSNVNTKDNYPEVLEDYLSEKLKCSNISNFEVINLGVPGYDIEYAVERFYRKGIKYNPDLILWLINYWNLDNINELKIPIYNNFISSGTPSLDENSFMFTAHELAAKEVIKRIGLNNILNQNRDILDEFSKIYKGNLVIMSFSDIPEKYKKTLSDIIK